MKKLIIPLLVIVWIITLFLAFKDADKLNLANTGRVIIDAINVGRPTALPEQKNGIYYVKRVIDGDTIELENGQTVRYIGINTPETADPRKAVECFGKEASEANKKLVENKTVRLEKDVSETDKYGRLLRYVYVNNIFINDYLLKYGFAQVSTFPPDVKYKQQFIDSQNEARKNIAGLWKDCPLK